MYKRKLKTGDIFLILVNLIPLFGVLYENWDPKEMFLVYCLETVIIGGYNVIKMLLVIITRPREKWEVGNGGKVGGLFYVVFFIIHYGFFVFIQMSIFGGVSGLAGDSTFGP